MKIWETPEIGYQGVHGHEVQFECHGRIVSSSSEYNALPGLGHACGHNPIAMGAGAAVTGVKDAFDNQGLNRVYVTR